jgi:hypothetical protein
MSGPRDPVRYYSSDHSDSWCEPTRRKTRPKPQYHPSTYLECLIWRWTKRLQWIFLLALFCAAVFGLILSMKDLFA